MRHVVELGNGNSVALSMSFDIFKLSKKDRAFVMSLIDTFRSHEPDEASKLRIVLRTAFAGLHWHQYPQHRGSFDTCEKGLCPQRQWILENYPSTAAIRAADLGSELLSENIA